MSENDVTKDAKTDAKIKTQTNDSCVFYKGRLLKI